MRSTVIRFLLILGMLAPAPMSAQQQITPAQIKTLSSCGDASHALKATGTPLAFGCQAISVASSACSVEIQSPATIVSGSPGNSVFDNTLVVQMPSPADAIINVVFQVPKCADITKTWKLALTFAPETAPGVTNNKVKLKITAKPLNTPQATTAGDTITLANNTSWADYSGTNNIVTGSTYAIGDPIQVQIIRDTSVANNAAVNFDINTIGFTQ